jgi:hypothetical protein
VIPDPEQRITCEEAARFRLTQLAAALVRDGVPVDVVMADVREGVELAKQSLSMRPPL